MARMTTSPESSEKKIAYGNCFVRARRTPGRTSVKAAGHSEMRITVSDRSPESCCDRGRLASIPACGFRKLGTRFLANNDAWFHSSPKIFRSTESHGSLSSGDARCASSLFWSSSASSSETGRSSGVSSIESQISVTNWRRSGTLSLRISAMSVTRRLYARGCADYSTLRASPTRFVTPSRSIHSSSGMAILRERPKYSLNCATSIVSPRRALIRSRAAASASR
jgi:hypothetical protein